MTGSIISFPRHILRAVGLQGAAQPWFILSIFPWGCPLSLPALRQELLGPSESSLGSPEGLLKQWQPEQVSGAGPWLTLEIQTGRNTLNKPGSLGHHWQSHRMVKMSLIFCLNHLYLSNFWTKFTERENCKMTWQEIELKCAVSIPQEEQHCRINWIYWLQWHFIMYPLINLYTTREFWRARNWV